jgi:hypothetical protein
MKTLNTLFTMMHNVSHSFTVILCPGITFLYVYPTVSLSVHSNRFALEKLHDVENWLFQRFCSEVFDHSWGCKLSCHIKTKINFYIHSDKYWIWWIVQGNIKLTLLLSFILDVSDQYSICCFSHSIYWSFAVKRRQFIDLHSYRYLLNLY